MSEDEKKEITKYSFKNLMFNFLHLMELKRMTKEDLAKKVTIQNIEAVKKAHEEKRPIIYVTPHYCAWELGAASVGAFIEPVTAVFKQMKDLQYQEWVLESRGTFGNKSLEKSAVIKPLIKLLRRGKACGIVIDTGINKREGLEVNFLGKTVRQTSTPAYLAKKYNAAIIPVTIRTDDEENYTMMLFDEIVVPNTDNEADDIQKATQLQADWLTKLVTDEPKFWFWIHRRWKGEHPEIYKKKV
jgi:KDO2-lipid IV(A) lauroyltransferase